MWPIPARWRCSWLGGRSRRGGGSSGVLMGGCGLRLYWTEAPPLCRFHDRSLRRLEHSFVKSPFVIQPPAFKVSASEVSLLVSKALPGPASRVFRRDVPGEPKTAQLFPWTYKI